MIIISVSNIVFSFSTISWNKIQLFFIAANCSWNLTNITNNFIRNLRFFVSHIISYIWVLVSNIFYLNINIILNNKTLLFLIICFAYI
ncbi:Hypothetical protein MAG5840 [Mycoplasmopsis agalactiae PG2]|uniref:Uncharacterized protein n=1 Tax=Mycoplasmopsis agalactiae (strain NCTC 10123 / CIP 59.7 / PG2) TaxID=347257 RepID=A5IZ25_MYCAP|nr:Hypothetical protein MAG5840 [Mycoplasmopsis agalactiae PG2]